MTIIIPWIVFLSVVAWLIVQGKKAKAEERHDKEKSKEANLSFMAQQSTSGPSKSTPGAPPAPFTLPMQQQQKPKWN